jgi:predicted protein tyrosine phosphatase
MFAIEVHDLEMAKIKMVNGPTCIVSLLDETRAVKKQGDHHLIVEVSDVSVQSAYYPALLLGTSKPIVPSSTHLQTVLDHTKNLTDDDKVLVHCYAGQSRSTAMAIAICIQHGMPWKDAFHHIETARPVMMPNQKMIALIDEHFGLNGELSEHHKTWLLETYSKLRVQAKNGFGKDCTGVLKIIDDNS